MTFQWFREVVFEDRNQKVPLKFVVFSVSFSFTFQKSIAQH